ncbi:MAG: hypothetical protein ABH878_07855 [bacterium]
MLTFPKNLYFHREHTWVRLEDNGLYRVGVDQIFLRDVGGVSKLDLPHEGDEISQDEVCGSIRGLICRKQLYAPLSGEIVTLNMELYEDLAILTDDSYGIGWILLLDSSDFSEEQNNLLFGEEAEVWWTAELKRRQAQ